jgi:hypothetical protein
VADRDYPPSDRSLRDDLEQMINAHSRENLSGTPDFILASFLLDCLTTYEATVIARDAWFGSSPKIAGTVPAVDRPEFTERRQHAAERQLTGDLSPDGTVPPVEPLEGDSQ